MSTAKPFLFICGADDFLVGRRARERFDAAVAEAQADEFSREIISGFAANGGEVTAALGRFREAVQQVSMFGGRRVIWLKDVNFFADTVTGRAEGTLTLVAELQELLGKLDPAELSVIVSAAPVDRRRAFPKWCEKTADFTLVGGDGEGGTEALASLVAAEAKTLGNTFSPDALQLLLARVGANTRLLLAEVHKLASYAGDGATIEEAHVAELTPNTAEGDFFETAEAFFRGDLTWTLAALQRHFFTGGDARPILSALQNRNRLLIQLRALVDGAGVRVGPRGVDKSALEVAAARLGGPHFGAALSEKSNYNVFAQNPWYLGKLVNFGTPPPLKRLIDHQQEFIAAFEEIVRRPDGQEDVLREMAVRCLAPAA